MATITTFAYDAVAGSPSYTSGNIIDWLYQLTFRANGVMPGSDGGLAVSTDGTGNVLVANGVCALGGRTAVLTAGPQTTAMTPLPANGFRTSYAVVMRYDTSTQTTAIVTIPGSTIANPGPAVNPSIVALTDVLLAYVLAVNTGSIAYTVTDARTFTNTGTFAPTGSTTYTASDLNINSAIIAPITANATIDITAGSIYKGTRLFIKNTSAGAYNITLHFSGSVADIIIPPTQWASMQWDGSAWVQLVTGYQYLQLTTGSSPYTLTPFIYPTVEISATTNPYVFNLPQASSCNGYKVRVVNTSSLATGLIKIVPYTGDKIGPLANNVACYLQNVDQSGWMNQQQNIELLSNGASWVVVGGQLMPEPGSVDTAGAQYYLGKLRMLPTVNATARVFSFAYAAGWSTAKQITGLYGIPTGAKAVLIMVLNTPTAAAAGSVSQLVAFADNNSVTPSFYQTAHPFSYVQGYGNAIAAAVSNVMHITVPLNSSGQFYVYGLNSINAQANNISVIPLGYYMGD